MKKLHIFFNSKKKISLYNKAILIALILIYAFLKLLIPTANAQEKKETFLISTPWNESEGGRVRLAVTKPSASKERHGIIEILLKPMWKTYWRNPGNSGIVPFFHFDQKVSYEIFYPTPQLYEMENDWSFGYTDAVTLPFSVLGSDDNLSGSLTIGICNKLCIPLTINFNFSSFYGENIYIPSSLLKNAQSTLPRHIQHNKEIINAKRDRNSLLITIRKNAKNTPLSLFLDGGEMQIGPAKKITDHEKYTFFSAPIYFAPNEKSKTVFYTISSEDYSFSGEFTIN
nr:protein-disulfide reductase DsbD domain-containing protein [Bartonella ancashensis]